MKKIVIILVLLTAILPHRAYGGKYYRDELCGHADNNSSIGRADAIFRGKLISTALGGEIIKEGVFEARRKATATFEVQQVYKGSLDNKIDVHFSVLSSGSIENYFRTPEVYYIFVPQNKNSGEYELSECKGRVISAAEKANVPLKRDMPQFDKEAIWAVEEMKARIEVLDRMFTTFGRLKELYFLKANIYESYGDFSSSQKVYEEMLRNFYEDQKQHTPPEYIASKVKEAKGQCQQYEAFSTSKEFLNTSYTHDWLYGGGGRVLDIMLRYAKALMNAGQYRDAFQPLCLVIVNNSSSGKNMDRLIKTQKLLNVARAQEGLPVEAVISNDELVVDFSGVDLSQAILSGLDFPDKKKAANFTGAGYDCKTKFPAGFEPHVYDMVNVDGTCPVQK